jgi:hypothetical protein
LEKGMVQTQLNSMIIGVCALIDAQTSILIESLNAGKVVWGLYGYLDAYGALTKGGFRSLGIISPVALSFSQNAILTTEVLLIATLASMRQIANAKKGKG